MDRYETKPATAGEALELRDSAWEFRKRRRAIRSGIGQTCGKRRIPHVVLGGVEHKSCARCGSLKPLSDYGPHRSSADGLQSACRDCIRKAP